MRGWLRSSLALYFCHRSSQGVLAAQNQLDYLKREYKKFGDGDENRFQTELKLPRPFGNPHDHYRGNATAVTFPKVMFVFWFIFATLQFVGAVVYLSDGMRGIFRAIHVSEKHNTEGVNNVAGIPAVISGKVPPVIVAPMPSPPPPSAAKPKKPKQSRQR
jgi:hypothetical protein